MNALPGARRQATFRQSMLEARDLRRSYGDLVAVSDVDVCLLPGEIHALVGLNGSGKTTLMRLLLGMVQPDAGLVALNGGIGL